MRRSTTERRSIPAGAIKIELPNVTQVTDHTCGASSLLAICAYFGVGPEDESDIAADMNMTKAGSDASHIMKAATKYGLRSVVEREMTDTRLIEQLDRGRPVMLTLQAWAHPRPKSYARHWNAGHWVVAVGYDERALYFEDPAMHTSRGFIERSELGERWHDIEGPRRTHVERLGIVLWRAGRRASRSAHVARRID